MIDLVIPARRKDLGGFEVGRVLPFSGRRMVGPFIFLNHMGPADFKPGEGIDVRPHPHVGLATVTYLYTGEIMHRDSLGSAQAIRPGAVNWMTAGRGISHSERADAKVRAQGGPVHGLQTWVALPDEHEDTAPAFVHHAAETLPKFSAGGAQGTVIAGSAYGMTSPVATFSPLFYVDLILNPGARFALPIDHAERAAYIVQGQVTVDGTTYDAGHMIVFTPGGEPVLNAGDRAAHLMLLGGAPVGQRFIYWNFVASSEKRIDAAKADWRAGRIPLPPDDNREFIPLPENPPALHPARS